MIRPALVELALARPQATLVQPAASRIARRWKSTKEGGIPPPLKGLRVLDLTTALAGPSCTMYLGDLGADVIKLEVPKKGDDSRNWGPPFMPHKEGVSSWTEGVNRQSTYFLAVNRNKKSVTINLKTPEGIKLAKELAKNTDVLIENQIAGKLEKLGLGYDAVKEINPNVIYASITGYGQTGPYRTNPGYDAVVGGEAGIVYATGEPDRAPVRPGIPVTDLMTGFAAVKAVLAGIISRSQTGKGMYIDVAMFDVQAAAMTNLASAWLNAGTEVVRVGTGHTNVAPYQVFNTKDGYIMIGIGNDVQFGRFCKELGTSWQTDENFKTNGERVKNKAKLGGLITEVLMGKTTKEWTDIFWGKGFPFGSVNNMEQTFNHPQVEPRGLVQTLDHPLIGKATVIAPAIVYQGERMPITKPPPGLGDDNYEVLGSLGYDKATIDEFKAKGVL